MRSDLKRPPWSVAEAKSKFSRLIAEARVGPQTIQSRGEPVATVLSSDAYAKLVEGARVGEGRARWLEFIEVSVRLGSEQALDLPLPVRERRPSPFAPRKRR
jgi:prevent-host-death family protein